MWALCLLWGLLFHTEARRSNHHDCRRHRRLSLSHMITILNHHFHHHHPQPLSQSQLQPQPSWYSTPSRTNLIIISISVSITIITIVIELIRIILQCYHRHYSADDSNHHPHQRHHLECHPHSHSCSRSCYPSRDIIKKGALGPTIL